MEKIDTRLHAWKFCKKTVITSSIPLHISVNKNLMRLILLAAKLGSLVSQLYTHARWLSISCSAIWLRDVSYLRLTLAQPHLEATEIEAPAASTTANVETMACMPLVIPEKLWRWWERSAQAAQLWRGPSCKRMPCVYYVFSLSLSLFQWGKWRGRKKNAAFVYFEWAT